MQMIPILEYRDFWDIPRIFLIETDFGLLLFDCEFDDDLEDFKETYKIFLMPSGLKSELPDAWHGLSLKAERLLTEIPINSVTFDETRRKAVTNETVEDVRSFFK